MVTIITLFGLRNIHDHATVEEKLRQGFEVNTVDSGGRTLLMEAVIQNDHTLVALLIQEGADVNMRDKREWTALHFAAQEYDVLSVRLLLEADADVNATDDYGNSVIARAVVNSKGKGDVIEALIENGADITIENKSGISALSSAESISNYDILKFLR